jgi:hypothetical protein
VALPITLALAVERGFIGPHEHVALLGIGSGINSLMIGVDWRGASVSPATPARSVSDGLATERDLRKSFANAAG